MVQNKIKPEIIKKVQLFVQKARQKGIKIDSLIVFGSQVSGQAKVYSDIDICIVSSQFSRNNLEDTVKLRLLADTVDWRIEPHVFSPKDMKMKGNPIVYEILTSGEKVI